VYNHPISVFSSGGNMCEGHHQTQCSCGGHSECDCEGDEGFERQFLTKAEQIEDLEEYLEELKLEIQAVEEHLADLKK
jgi:hypothetical protein